MGSDGHLYSINLLDGTVLLDGSPPSRLPKDILSHLLYKCVFGSLNFKIAVSKNGVLQGGAWPPIQLPPVRWPAVRH